MTKLFTFEAGVNEQYDVELFVSYHDALHQVLMIEPVSIVNQAKLKIRSILSTVNQLVTALHNGFNKTQINSVDQIQSFMIEVFRELDQIVQAMEEIAPEQAINGEITISDLISNAVGVTRDDIDNIIQVKKEQTILKLTLMIACTRYNYGQHYEPN